MGKKCLKIALPAIILVLSTTSLLAQGAGDVLRYSLQYPSYDPVSIVMPGVSDATGFGAWQENPASMALFDKSFMSFGLNSRYVNEDVTYLGNVSEFDDSQTNVGDAGFVYNVPTARGKLTIGAGYSQSHDYNRALAGSAQNNLSTITDFYASLPIDDPLNEAAFNAFAIDDYETEGGDIESLSIFRFLPEGEDFRGIEQRFEMTEEGTLGEFSAFMATELLKDLIVGASIGVLTGNYSYQREFLEADSQGNYDDAFIDTDDDGEADTDIDRILSEDTIDATFSGFSARLGLIYQITPNFNIGGSYQFKNTLHIDEEFGTEIITTMDNGVEFSGEDFGAFQYQITRPSRLNLGITARDLAGLTVSASAERVAYSEGRLEFEELDLGEIEQDVNQTVRNNLEDVYNLRFGLEYAINDQFIPRIGYAFYPSPNSNFNADRQFYSAGFTAKISDNTEINLGAQLGRWNDQNTLYSTPNVTEVADEEVNHWNVMAGVSFNF